MRNNATGALGANDRTVFSQRPGDRVPRGTRSGDPVTERVFVDSTGDARRVLAAANEQGRVNFLLASVFINSESAKLAYFLSRLFGTQDEPHRRRTFFANSTLEALSGAIKLARHTQRSREKLAEGWVLVVDPRSTTAALSDPLGRGPEQALVPHVIVVESAEMARAMLNTREWAAVVLRRDPIADAPADRLLMASVREAGAMRILNHGDRPVGQLDLGVIGDADVHVLGENATDCSVPFGSFTMTRSAYQVWNNVRDSTLHTSTFGGNGSCLAVVLDTVARHGLVDDLDRAVFDDIESNLTTRLKVFKRHVNGHVAIGMEVFGFDLDIAEARGSELLLKDGRHIADLAGGTGASLRGHNPPSVRATLESHRDGDTTYTEGLRERLHRLTGLPRIFPAVSGATAVDTALRLAVLANPERPKIVTFRGNYSGKTLPSSTLSLYGPQALETDVDAFAPYYAHVTYLEPFDDDAPEQLAAVLDGEDVGVLWFEAVQGLYCQPLPEALLDVVRQRSDRTFILGVDEVLTGGCRLGHQFLASQLLGLNPDLVTLAKPLSDMTIPIGVVMASDQLVARASATDAHAVDAMTDYYRNELGAHVAIEALDAVVMARDEAKIDRVQRVMREELEQLVERSSLFDAVEGEGSLLRLNLHHRWFPFGTRSDIGKVAEMAVSDLILRNAEVLVAALRLFPPLLAENETAAIEAIHRLDEGTRHITPMRVYRHAIAQVMRLAGSQARSRVRRAIPSRRTASDIHLTADAR